MENNCSQELREKNRSLVRAHYPYISSNTLAPVIIKFTE